MAFPLLLNLAASFLFAATCYGASPNTVQLAPPQTTNKPLYLDLNAMLTSVLPAAGQKKGTVWNNKTTEIVSAIPAASPNGRNENDTNSDKPQYQCFYQGNYVVICQDLDKCPKTPNRTELTLPDNRTFSGYACAAPLARMHYSVKSGIATRGYMNILTQNTRPLEVLFVCHFFNHEVPAERSFACSDPLDCGVRGALSPCSGGIPWYGVWTGDLELGLWGVITAEAMESG